MAKKREENSGPFERLVVMQAMVVQSPQSVQLSDFPPPVPSILDRGAEKVGN